MTKKVNKSYKEAFDRDAEFWAKCEEIDKQIEILKAQKRSCMRTCQAAQISMKEFLLEAARKHFSDVHICGLLRFDKSGMVLNIQKPGWVYPRRVCIHYMNGCTGQDLVDKNVRTEWKDESVYMYTLTAGEKSLRDI